MAENSLNTSPLNVLLKQRVPSVPMTHLLIAANLAVFLAMLVGGAGFWHSPNSIQLAWGANFGPATQDGEWWRLGSALFLHFGAIHLFMNLCALWDGGRLVERMYGHVRFIAIYFTSGLAGNLVSLVIQGGSAVSGGASGAIFGVYGSLLVFLWRERQQLDPYEFRWMFWGAVVFSALTIGLGFIIPGIDNSAHIGGFITGIVSGTILAPVFGAAKQATFRPRIFASGLLVLAIAGLISKIPAPAYKWSDELLVRQEINEFLRNDQAINRSWLDIVNDGKRGDTSFDELAGRIDADISEHYEDSFEQLSQLPVNPAMPSAKALENALKYAQQRRDASRALAEKLRDKQAK
ncbi:MAG TPA: rhomboid family intramembrane serine protease [Methylophilaceae bacterium]|nr:rhomboid family intramembrane serine protease [Methylophilaceae bacterium]